MKKILIVLFLSYSIGGFSQARHELSVQAGGALTTLNFKTDFGNSSFSGGGLLGLGYSCFFSPTWGVSSGVEVALYTGNVKMSTFSDVVNNLTDSDGDTFNFQSTVSGYKEDQRAFFLNIPLLARFQTKGETKLYAAAGGKLGIPLQGRYKGTGATFVNRAYYPAFNNFVDAPSFMGLGTFSGRTVNETVALKVAFMLSAEAGMKFDFKNNRSLYAGLYLDYGLTDIIKDNRQASFIVYNSAVPAEFSNRSVMESGYVRSNGVRSAFTDKVIPIAIGLKVAFAFGKDVSVSPVEN